MKNKFTIKVKVNSERPDFRILGTFFFGDDFYNFDSEGDSIPVSSRKWTELYMCSRQNRDLWFDIANVNNNPLIFEIISDKNETINIIAYFLAKETNGEVLDNRGHSIPLETLKNKMGSFNLEERLSLADKSIWRKTTKENPYPNLTENP